MMVMPVYVPHSPTSSTKVPPIEEWGFADWSFLVVIVLAILFLALWLRHLLK